MDTYHVVISPIGSLESVCTYTCPNLERLMESLLDMHDFCRYIERLRPYRRVNVSVYVRDESKQFCPLKCIFDADVSTFP